MVLYTVWLSKLYFSLSIVQKSDFAEGWAYAIKRETVVVFFGEYPKKCPQGDTHGKVLST